MSLKAASHIGGASLEAKETCCLSPSCFSLPELYPKKELLEAVFAVPEPRPKKRVACFPD